APGPRSSSRSGTDAPRCVWGLALPLDRGAEEGADAALVPDELVRPELGLRPEPDLDREPGARRPARRRVGAGADDAVLRDRAHRAVAAEDADAERVLDVVVLDLAHRHLRHRDAAHGRRLDPV